MPQAPSCVGTYERLDIVCNGEPTGKTDTDRAPCAWRNRCSGLRIYCEERGKAPEIVVASSSYAALVDLCETHVVEHRVWDGIAGNAPMTTLPDPPPKPEKQKSYKKRLAPSLKNKRPKRIPTNPLPLEKGILEFATNFENLLRDKLPNRRFASGKRLLVKPGTFYPVDRSKASRYISWYCTVSNGPDRAVASIRFKPRLGTVDIALPVAEDELAKAGSLKGFEVKKAEHGQFRILLTHLDKKGVAGVVNLLEKLLDKEILALP